MDPARARVTRDVLFPVRYIGYFDVTDVHDALKIRFRVHYILNNMIYLCVLCNILVVVVRSGPGSPDGEAR